MTSHGNVGLTTTARVRWRFHVLHQGITGKREEWFTDQGNLFNSKLPLPMGGGVPKRINQPVAERTSLRQCQVLPGSIYRQEEEWTIQDNDNGSRDDKGATIVVSVVSPCSELLMSLASSLSLFLPWFFRFRIEQRRCVVYLHTYSFHT